MSQRKSHSIPLSEEYQSGGLLKPKSPKRKRNENDHHEKENFIDAKASHKILKIRQELAQEELDQAIGTTTNSTFSFTLDSSIANGSSSENVDEIYDDDEAWEDDSEDLNNEEVQQLQTIVFVKDGS